MQDIISMSSRLLVFFAIVLVSGLGLVTCRPSHYALPPQGVYEAIGLNTSWQSRLDQIAAAGFKVVLNYAAISIWESTVSTAQLDAYADYANSKGLQIIWDFVDLRASKNPIEVFTTLNTDLGATTNSDFVTKLTNHLQSLPATYGYYIEDELTASAAREVITLGDAIRSVDSTHPTMGANYSNQWRSGDMQALEPAMSIVGFDHYPIGVFATADEQYAYDDTRIKEVVNWVKTTNKPLIPILQAHDSCATYPATCQWYPYSHWLTATEITSLRDHMLTVAKANGVSVPLIMWYSYFDIEKYKPSAWNTLIAGAFAKHP